MKTFRINILCALFFLGCSVSMLCAQTTDGGENYYSNPQKGIRATAPKPYHDTTVVSMSDDLTVELVGETMDTVQPHRDSIRGQFDSAAYYDYAYTARINRFHRGTRLSYYDDYYTDLYWYTGNPHYLGTSIYCGWHPWYVSWGWSWGSPWYWDPFYYSYYGWGSPWYWDPFYYPGYYGYYGWGGYYGYYGWGGYYGYYGGWGGYAHSGMWGHGYLGGGSRNNPTSLFPRTTSTLSAAPASGRTVRRGGVDINNGGRGLSHQVSGTGTAQSGRGATAQGSRGATTSNGRYARPSSLSESRSAQTSRRTGTSQSQYGSSRSGSRGTATTSTSDRSRGSYSTGRTSSSRSDSFTPSSSSRSSSASRSSSSSRSSGTSTRSSSSSSSRSSSFSGSSTRSSGSSHSGGSHSGGGGHSGGGHSGGKR